MCIAAGASPHTHTGGITELPKPPSWFPGAASWQGRGGEGEEKEEKEESGRGYLSPLLLFTI